MEANQKDFDSLTFSDSLQHDSIFDREAFSGDIVPNDAYVLVHEFSDEIRSYLAAAEAAFMKRATSSHGTENVDSVTAHTYEPLRPMTDPAPPKRFYRTFWRSIARRVLHHHKQSARTEI